MRKLLFLPFFISSFSFQKPGYWKEINPGINSPATGLILRQETQKENAPESHCPGVYFPVLMTGQQVDANCRCHLHGTTMRIRNHSY